MVRCVYKEEKHELRRDRIIKACGGSRDIRDKAMLSIHYLNATRSEELSLIRRGDIKILPDLIKFRIVTKKRRGSHKDEYRYINIPVEQSQPLSGYIIRYVKTLPRVSHILLFPGKRRCQQIIKEITGHGSHCIRHSRLNHLADNGFDQFDLQAYVNWSKPDMALEYVKRSGVKIEKKLREAGI